MERTPRAQALAEEMMAGARQVAKVITINGTEVVTMVTELPPYDPTKMGIDTEDESFSETLNIVPGGAFGPFKE